MRISGALTVPLAGIDDPVASGLHLAGALAVAAMTPRLMRRAGDARWRGAALLLFAAAGIVVLTTSAAYHTLAASHPWKLTLQRADHAAIFLLIAATLSSYHAVGFRGRGRWWFAGVTWVIGLSFLLTKTLYWAAIGDGLGLLLYVGLSALGLGAIAVLPRHLPWRAYAVMGLGAGVYVAGALMDHADVGWLVPAWFGPHEWLHVAVVAALGLHWTFFHTWAAPGAVPDAPDPEPLALPAAGADSRA